MTEVDTAKLYATTDAKVWTEEFMKVFPDVDEGTVLSWFANAIETARDKASVSMGVSQPTGNPLSEGLNERDTVAVPSEMPERFADWLEREMPPHTIIADARWWAPRIWRAMIFDKYR